MEQLSLTDISRTIVQVPYIWVTETDLRFWYAEPRSLHELQWIYTGSGVPDNDPSNDQQAT